MALPGTSDDVDDLRRSIDDRSLHLLYQPEVDLATGTIVAMEALLRWQHPERGLLGPAEFLELAASGGELSRIGDWVLREGLAEAVRWGRLPGPTRRLRLNVVDRELAAPASSSGLRAWCRTAGCRPARSDWSSPSPALQISVRLQVRCSPGSGRQGWRWRSTTSAAGTSLSG